MKKTRTAMREPYRLLSRTSTLSHPPQWGGLPPYIYLNMIANKLYTKIIIKTFVMHAGCIKHRITYMGWLNTLNMVTRLRCPHNLPSDYRLIRILDVHIGLAHSES